MNPSVTNTLATIAFIIAVVSLLFNIASRVWKVRAATVSRISLLIQVLILLGLCYLLIRLLGQ